MSKKNKITILITILLIFPLLNGINILQNGWERKDLDLSLVYSAKSDREMMAAIHKLSKREILDLYYLLPEPKEEFPIGDYEGELVEVGVMSPFSGFYTHHIFGPGRWKGKTISKENDSYIGFNRFCGNEDCSSLLKEKRFLLKLAHSRIDQKLSWTLDYSSFNDGLVHGMYDELRPIKKNIFLGMGTMSVGGGALNPAPFLLITKN
ncbi:hypothetical protein [Leptospira sp. 'Mane']|uniref:hypothetical protein n=1 Tax=Leptospira sp. 'Mane' TaxID=3387407 RepID=UPI00398B37AD